MTLEVSPECSKATRDSVLPVRWGQAGAGGHRPGAAADPLPLLLL